MGWREYAESVQQGRDNRDDKDNRPDNAAIVPIVPNVPRVVADSIFREWGKVLRDVDPDKPNDGFALERWRQLHSASIWWLEGFGRQAARDGWGAGDVFGLRVGYERRGGLIDQLDGCRALVMEGGRARWRSSGVAFSHAAGAYPNLAAWWST